MPKSGMTEYQLPGGIREVKVQKAPDGTTEQVSIVFGPHFFVVIDAQSGHLKFTLGATHHGVTLDASTISGELEQAIDTLRSQYPNSEE